MHKCSARLLNYLEKNWKCLKINELHGHSYFANLTQIFIFNNLKAEWGQTLKWKQLSNHCTLKISNVIQYASQESQSHLVNLSVSEKNNNNFTLGVWGLLNLPPCLEKQNKIFLFCKASKLGYLVPLLAFALQKFRGHREQDLQQLT